MSFIFFLPTLVAAEMEVNITCQFHAENPNVEVRFAGSEVNVLADKERIPFGLTDVQLKDCVRKYMGRLPEDVYLHSPTPWDDLYDTYKWREVARTVVPKSGRMLNITTEPEVVSQQYFVNKSQKPENYSIVLCGTVEAEFVSSWKRAEELDVSGEILYGLVSFLLNINWAPALKCRKPSLLRVLDIKIVELGRYTSLSFTSSWGHDVDNIETVPVGSTSPWKILLEPGQVARAQLIAIKGVINVEVEYEASLFGDIVVNYNPLYNGHHFWAPNIQQVMKVCSLSNAATYKQTLNMVLYAGPKIELVDLKSKEVIGEFFF